MEEPAYLSVEAYLAFEAAAERRHEYWHGRLIAMAGESYHHNAVKDDLVAALRAQTSCDVLSSGLRVRAPHYGREHYAYPDAVVMCAAKRFDETSKPPTLLNPTVLVEVVSESTRGRDFGDKLAAYFRLDSLLEYWIVEADRPYVVRYQRLADQILVHMMPGLDQEIVSEALQVCIPLREIYRRINIEPTSPNE